MKKISFSKILNQNKLTFNNDNFHFIVKYLRAFVSQTHT